MSDLPPATRPTLDAHPRKRWVQPVLIAVILLVVAVGAWLAWDWTHTSSPAVQAAKAAKAKGGRFGPAGVAQPVTAVAAKVGDVNVVQTALGTVLAARTSTVHARVDGLLLKVAYGEGDLVLPGAFLAQIDPAPFQVALEQAEGQLARDVATLNNARLDLERYRTLLAQDSIAGQQADQQAAQVKTLEGTVKMDQAQVDNAKLQLSYTHITAPIGGRLGLRQVDEGNIVHSSDTNGVAVITQVNPIAVVFTIPQDTLPPVLARLRKGEKPAVDAWDREQKELLSHGSLISTDNQIDVTTGTVKLKAEFPNPESKLFPNQFVNVRMILN
jgi:multidrug efflux system membrane fusion protein